MSEKVLTGEISERTPEEESLVMRLRVFNNMRWVGIVSVIVITVFARYVFDIGFATLPVYMARFREQQGMFVAQLSASSTIAVLPAIIFGWMTQRSLVKGLTLGAVKG